MRDDGSCLRRWAGVRQRRLLMQRNQLSEWLLSEQRVSAAIAKRVRHQWGGVHCLRCDGRHMCWWQVCLRDDRRCLWCRTGVCKRRLRVQCHQLSEWLLSEQRMSDAIAKHVRDGGRAVRHLRQHGGHLCEWQMCMRHHRGDVCSRTGLHQRRLRVHRNQLSEWLLQRQHLSAG